MATQAEKETSGGTSADAAKANKPPIAMMKIVNPIMKALLRSPLGNKMGDMIMVITFKGRKSGKVFTTPVSYLPAEDGSLMSFTDSHWGKNFDGGAPVTVLVKRQKYRATSTSTYDPQAVAAGIKYFFDKKGVKNARRIGVNFSGDHYPSQEELLKMADHRALIKTDLRDPVKKE